MVAHILELHVDGYMLQLSCNGRDSLFAAQGQLIKTGKTLHCVTDLIGLSLQCHPVDHIHGVIKKMWIDLCLEGIEFCDPEIFGSLSLFLHQFFHFSSHIVVGIDKITDLIMCLWTFHRSRRAVADGLHLPDHRRKPSGNGMSQYIGKNKCQNQKNCIDQYDLDHQPVALMYQRRGRQDRHHKPVRIGNTVKTGINLCVQNVPLNEVIGRHKGSLDGVVIQLVDSG